MCPTLLQLFGTVVKAKANISLAASTSQSLNSTFNFPLSFETFPVINAWALIKAQSSNLGLIWAISGFCKKASLLKGLNKPDCLRLFSTTLEISAPRSSKFNFFLKSFAELLSWERGDTAIGKGFRFPLVISTSIRAIELVIVIVNILLASL